MLTQFRAQALPVEKFEADLQAVCGEFCLRPAPGASTMKGGVARETVAGVEVAHVAADLQQITRSNRAIRRDPGANYFLILQEEGRSLMTQNDVSCLLRAGDMVLIDSTQSSEFTFFGEFNRQLSLHLPRGEMHARFGQGNVRGGTNLPRNDPTNIALCAVLHKVFSPTPLSSTANSFLREAMFGLIGAALHERSGDERNFGSDIGAAQVLMAGQNYIDCHYRDASLTIHNMADELGISLRQLQRGFSAIGTTPTKYLLLKRLEHAKRGIEDRRANRRDDLFSSIAYEAGFSDLSYFQRTFRRAFGASPRAYCFGQTGEGGREQTTMKQA